MHTIVFSYKVILVPRMFEYVEIFFIYQSVPCPDSTAQTGNADCGDWKEEIYQKIKSMKDMYFLDLNEMYQKLAAKMHQCRSCMRYAWRLSSLSKTKCKAFGYVWLPSN